MSVKEKNDNLTQGNKEEKDKKKWNFEDWMFHLLLLFAIALVPIATIILIIYLPEAPS